VDQPSESLLGGALNLPYMLVSSSGLDDISCSATILGDGVLGAAVGGSLHLVRSSQPHTEMNSLATRIPGLEKYPDLKRGLEYEQTRLRAGCPTCEVGRLIRKYAKLKRERESRLERRP
jgi:hypothetical protein